MGSKNFEGKCEKETNKKYENWIENILWKFDMNEVWNYSRQSAVYTYVFFAFSILLYRSNYGRLTRFLLKKQYSFIAPSSSYSLSFIYDCTFAYYFVLFNFCLVWSVQTVWSYLITNEKKNFFFGKSYPCFFSHHVGMIVDCILLKWRS